MTAEIAILNKSAVALAADSAVTISAANREEKTFDSADKLFELCHHNSIGVMIYNGLSFAEVPLQSIIKNFRATCLRFNDVRSAATSFLAHLDEFGRSAPQRVKDDSIRSLVRPALERVNRRYGTRVNEIIQQTQAITDIPKTARDTLDEAVGFYERIYDAQPDAQFVGGTVPAISVSIQVVIAELVDATFTNRHFQDEQKRRLRELANLALRKNVLTDGSTGIVIAGFGSKELFPTLMSFEIDGIVGDRLKYVDTNFVDIDRNGPRARVIPFAQKEMVDRFLYGVDDGIEENITGFCRRTIPEIRKAIASRIEFVDDEAMARFANDMEAAEQSFGLHPVWWTPA